MSNRNNVSNSNAAQEAAAQAAREAAAQRAREEAAAQRARAAEQQRAAAENNSRAAAESNPNNADNTPLRNFSERSGLEPRNSRALFEIKNQNNPNAAQTAALRSGDSEPVLDYRAATMKTGAKPAPESRGESQILSVATKFLGKAFDAIKKAAQAPPPPAEDRILSLAKSQNAAEATSVLNDELKNIQGADATQKREELINNPKVQEALREVGRQATTGADVDGDQRDAVLEERQHQITETYKNLSRAAEIAGADGAKSLANGFAQGVNDFPQSEWETNQFNTITYSTNKNAITSAIMNGDGARFASNLALEMNKLNKPGGATVAQEVESSLRNLNDEFSDKAEKVKELNQQLNESIALSGLPPSDPRAQKAINNFLADHKKEFDEYEEAGRKLSSTLEGANDIIKNQAALPDMPHADDAEQLLGTVKDITDAETIGALGQTKAGQTAIANSLEQQGAEKSTFTDLIPQQLQNVDTLNSHGASIANAMTRATGARIVQLANQPGREREASKLLRGFMNHHAAFGIDRPTMNGLAGDMRKVLTSTADPQAKQAALNSLDERLRGLEADTPGIKNIPGAAGALKGLGFVVSLAGQADAISNWSQQDLAGKATTIAGGIGLTADGASTALQIFGADATAAGKFFGKVAPGVSGVTAILEGFAAVKSITEGDYAGAAISGASAAGGTLLAAYGLRAAGVFAIPGIGQGAAVVGAVLTIGAAGAGFVKGRIDEGNLEKAHEKFLNDTGLKPETSDRLSDVNDGKTVAQFVSKVAPQLGMTPRQFVERMQTWSNDDLEKVVEMAHNLDTNDKGEIEQTADNDQRVGEKIDRTAWFDGTEEPKSITGAANWLRRENLV